MFNIGQLMRERRSQDGVVLVGFGSYRGSVIAGREWDAPMEVMPVPEAREDGWEDVLHHSFGNNAMLIFSDEDGTKDLFRRVRGL